MPENFCFTVSLLFEPIHTSNNEAVRQPKIANYKGGYLKGVGSVEDLTVPKSL